MHLTRREWHAAVVGSLVSGPLGRRPHASPGTPRSGTKGHAATRDMSQAGGWHMLFDGTSMPAWRGYKADALPAGWRVADGVLSKDAAVPDIISRDQFGDFELELAWRIGEAGNSGIFYRGTEEYDRIYWSAPEYQ